MLLLPEFLAQLIRCRPGLGGRLGGLCIRRRLGLRRGFRLGSGFGVCRGFDIRRLPGLSRFSRILHGAGGLRGGCGRGFRLLRLLGRERGRLGILGGLGLFGHFGLLLLDLRLLLGLGIGGRFLSRGLGLGRRSRLGVGHGPRLRRLLRFGLLSGMQNARIDDRRIDRHGRHADRWVRGRQHGHEHERGHDPSVQEHRIKYRPGVFAQKPRHQCAPLLVCRGSPWTRGAGRSGSVNRPTLSAPARCNTTMACATTP